MKTANCDKPNSGLRIKSDNVGRRHLIEGSKVKEWEQKKNELVRLLKGPNCVKTISANIKT